MRIPWRHLAPAALLLAVTACGERNVLAPDGVGTLVVDGVLIVGQPLPSIYVGQTLAPDATYSTESAAVSGASVHVRTGGREVRYVEIGSGSYAPFVSDVVEAERTYTLEVVASDGRRAFAETTTPATFAVDRWVILDDETLAVRDTLDSFEDRGAAVHDSTDGNVLRYRYGLLEARFARGDVPSYQVGLHSLDPESPFVIDPDFFEEEDFEELERVTSSPLLEAPDGTIRLPWLAIYFEGRYTSYIHAVDRNWYDFVRTSPELGQGGPGFGGNLGDGVDEPIFHVEGGIGLFGSAAVDSVGFYIRPGQ